MIRLEDLTQDELADLTDADIARYIDITCAENGVRLLPILYPEPLEPEGIDPDVEIYTVGGYHFRFKDDAEEVVKFINSMSPVTSTYVSGPSYARKITPSLETATMSTEKWYSEDQWAKVGPAQESYEKAYKEWKADRDEFLKIQKQRSTTENEVWAKVIEARRERNKKLQLRQEWARHLELAGGNLEVAVRFFKNAYPDIESRHPGLMAELAPAQEAFFNKDIEKDFSQ